MFEYCGIFHLWTHLRKDNKRLIIHFILSRRDYVHQEEFRVFLALCCANALNYVKNYNLRMLLDLIVKLVVDYTDVRLIPCDFVAGKKCIWIKERYQKFGVVGGILRGSGLDTEIPYGDDYESRVKKMIHFLFTNAQWIYTVNLIGFFLSTMFQLCWSPVILQR